MGKKRKAEGQSENASKRAKVEDERDWFSTPPRELASTEEKLTRRQLKKQKRAERFQAKQEDQAQTDTLPPPAKPVLKAASSVNQTKVVPKPEPAPVNQPQTKVVPKPEPAPEPAIPLPSNPPMMVLTPPYPCSTLLQFTNSAQRPSWFYTIIGIVSSISDPSQTRNGAFKTRVSLLDPSMHYKEPTDFLLDPQALTVNCFGNTRREWMPQASPGDAIILRSMKRNVFKGAAEGVGYGDRLQWVCVSRVSQTPVNVVCEQRTEQTPHGLHTPFTDPSGEELNYCKHLLTWHSNVLDRIQQARGIVHRVDASSSASSRPKKTYKELQHLSPQIEPDGFCNLVVELLHKFIHPADSRMVSLFVTDYTQLSETCPQYNGDWCAGRDPSMVFRIECWDESRPLADQRQVGDFLDIKNVKIRSNNGGYLEGRMQGPKLYKLDESAASSNTWLANLLERKERCMQERDDEFRSLHYCQIGNFQVSTYTNTIVQVIDPQPTADPPLLLVSDYTFRQDLCKTKFVDSWMLGRVVRITLDGSQVEYIKKISPKSYICIQNLRLKVQGDGSFGGHLGGPKELIREASVRNIEAEPFIEEMKQRHSRISRKSFKDIVPDAELGVVTKYKVLAKLVGRSKNNMIHRYCEQCNVSIPRHLEECDSCQDATQETLTFTMTFRLEDHSGDTLEAPLAEDCSLIKLLRLKSFLNHPQELKSTLYDIFTPYVGNFDSEKGPLGGRWATFTIACWTAEVGKRFEIESVEKP